MDALLLVAAIIGTVAIAGGAGFAAGRRLRGRASWLYWASNVLALCAGAAVLAFGYRAGSDPLLGAGLAVIAGGTTGLKYGLGRVTGFEPPEAPTA